MQIELRRLQQSLGITTIVVTHDQSEAMTISDRIAVMRHGTVEQSGHPMEVYDRPGTEFVARFIGAMNILECSWEDGCAWFGNIHLETRPANRSGYSGKAPVRVAIRPERVALENVGANGENGIAGDGPNRLRGTIDFIRNTGNLVEVHANCGPARIVHAFSPRAGGDPGFCEGDGIVAHLPPEHCHLYGNEDQ